MPITLQQLRNALDLAQELDRLERQASSIENVDPTKVSVVIGTKTVVFDGDKDAAGGAELRDWVAANIDDNITRVTQALVTLGVEVGR